ncbi:cobalt-precorrin 5A hydrolase [Clostridium sp. HBUAS56010]|uniref:cobalt-precorrin 5A hydrolase n=1 Tax=Clostridium sp. HBUAS56010 TaxID=2571127 RepID=UPI00117742A8|nr:cobalt-precorrin 5A hydrolase [Clostridium sp. HBUAS56010]
MKLSLICFTKAGAGLCVHLMEELAKEGDQCQGFGPSEDRLFRVSSSLKEWTRQQFEQKDGIIFIGAAGIAVRAIAPFLQGKDKDPAVVVLDDMGHFSISLLSGHLGGANELTKRAAKITGAQAVITTATDIHDKFAVDLFAQEQGLYITRLPMIKEISSALLNEEKVGFFSDFPVEGNLPQGLSFCQSGKTDLYITIKDQVEENLKHALKLVPRVVVLGIGCRKGIPVEGIVSAVDQVLKAWNISKESLRACASIDLKKEEEGICRFANINGIPFVTYPAKVLLEAEGTFTPSPFVKQVTGVDNVCERAAITFMGELGGGSLFIKKQPVHGVTVAAAVLDWKVRI